MFRIPVNHKNPPHPFQNPHLASLSHYAANMDYLSEAVDTRGCTIKKDETVSMSFLNHMALNVSFNEIDVSLAAQTRSNSSKVKDLAKDGNDDIFTQYPLLTKAALAKQGMHTQFLRHKDQDWKHFTASGSIIEIDENCRKLVRTGFLVDTNAQFCFNEALGSLISAAFDMSTIDCKGLNKTHHAAHSVQQLWILFFNRCQYAKSTIVNDFQHITLRPVSTAIDLLNLHSEVSDFYILFNILDGSTPFLSGEAITQQVIENLQRNTHLLAAAYQPLFDKALQTLQNRIDNKEPVSSTTLLIHLTPLLPNADKSETAFSAAPTLEFRRVTDPMMQPPTLDGPSETAFVAQLRDRQLLKPPDHLRRDRRDTPRQGNERQDTRVDPRQDSVRRDTRVDSRQDSVRRDTRVDSRQDNHERRDTRRDIRQDYERGIARPEAHHLRNVDPPVSSHTLEDMQRTMAMLQSQLEPKPQRRC